jgi:hypothetical protein
MYDVRQYAHDHGLETFDVFDLAWRYSHFGNRCRQGEVPRDHTNWLNSKGKIIPWYVLRYLKSNAQLPTMPKGAK